MGKSVANTIHKQKRSSQHNFLENQKMVKNPIIEDQTSGKFMQTV